MTVEKLLFNDIMSMSIYTAILEASDWDESVASKISFIIRNTKSGSNLEEAKSNLKKALLEENISKNIIDNIFMLIDIEQSRIKSRPRLWIGNTLKKLER